VEAQAFRSLTRELAARRQHSPVVRSAFLVQRVCTGSPAAREYLASRVFGRPATDWVRRRVQSIVHSPPLVPVAHSASA
jgi:hypothetical protein